MASSAQFTVSWMPDCRQAVERLVQRAMSIGQVQPLAHFLKELESALRSHPREWGDPIRNWSGLHAVEFAHTSATNRFRAYYLVHNTAPAVFVRDIVVLPDNPLRQTNGEPR